MATDEGTMLGEPDELDLDETRAVALKRIGRRITWLNLSNASGKEIPGDTLADALGSVDGSERIKTAYVGPSSLLRDVRFIRALPRLEALFVLGRRIETLAGIESFRHGRYLEVFTGKNRKREIGALAEAPISHLTLSFASPGDLAAIGRSRTLNLVRIASAPNLELARWSSVPLEVLVASGGAIDAFGDTDRIATLREITLQGCRKLQRFEGRCGNVERMSVEMCPRLDWRTLKVFRGLRYLYARGGAPLPLTILRGLPELREASLLRADATGVRDLSRLAPKLEKLYAGGLGDDVAMRLSRVSRRVVIDTGRRTFAAGVEQRG